MNETLELVIESLSEDELNLCVYDDLHTKDFLKGVAKQYNIPSDKVLKVYNFHFNRQIEEQYESGLEYQTFVISIFNAKNMTLKYISKNKVKN